LKLLNRHKVDYLVVGGYAVGYQKPGNEGLLLGLIQA
jgi:hypothetical protein